jgi:AraC-like DNA-binding protein
MMLTGDREFADTPDAFITSTVVRPHSSRVELDVCDSNIDVADFASRCQSLLHDLETSEDGDAFAYVQRLIESIPDVPQGPARATIQNMALVTLGRMLAHALHRTSREPGTQRQVAQRASDVLSLVRSVTRGVTPPCHPRVTATVHFIEAHHSNPELRLSDVATHVSLSASHLDRLLKQNTGLTFVQHLREVRLRRATLLLRTGLLTIKEIGVGCGYKSTSSFDRDFRRVHGCTPTELRRRHLGICPAPVTELRLDWKSTTAIGDG